VTPKPPSDNLQKCLGFHFEKQLPAALKKIHRAAQFKNGRILMMMTQGLAIHHPSSHIEKTTVHVCGTI
jgi:hypothetical protein